MDCTNDNKTASVSILEVDVFSLYFDPVFMRSDVLIEYQVH
jgi:hypothetical protein